MSTDALQPLPRPPRRKLSANQKAERERRQSTERGRKFRARGKAKEGLAKIRYPHGLPDLLVGTGWLAPNYRPGDTTAVADALERMVFDAVANFLKRR
jgi:hypothetical protein